MQEITLFGHCLSRLSLLKSEVSMQPPPSPRLLTSQVVGAAEPSQAPFIRALFSRILFLLRLHDPPTSQRPHPPNTLTLGMRIST